MNGGGGCKGRCDVRGQNLWVVYKMEHFDLLPLLLSLSGKTTDLMASSNTCLSPVQVLVGAGKGKRG